MSWDLAAEKEVHGVKQREQHFQEHREHGGSADAADCLGWGSGRKGM